MEAQEAKQYAQPKPISYDTPESEQDATSVTINGSEPEPGLMEADQKAATIYLKVQNRPEDKIRAWMQGVRDATSQEVGAKSGSTQHRLNAVACCMVRGAYKLVRASSCARIPLSQAMGTSVA
ncbi:hypothetical protein FGLOB1_5746 [Fusarium globosum]|uniref:Uncharacterized protein n=1 Tax=Fusarium globosum TaxID=78864 RepID=A0A8H5YD06_9HYPO|nr:hypothetical protein FGLOB1_5746 [Fusarium globosum]